MEILTVVVDKKESKVEEGAGYGHGVNGHLLERQSQAGPKPVQKGHQLQVGAQRAPRLLVDDRYRNPNDQTAIISKGN